MILLIFVTSFLLAASAPSDLDARVSELEEMVKQRLFDEAITGARDLLAELEAEGRDESVEAAELLEIIVKASSRAVKATSETLQMMQRALDIKERLLEPGHPAIGEAYHEFGNLLLGQREYEEARLMYENALEIRENAYGAEAVEIVPTLNNLGLLSRTLGDDSGAREHLERALAIRETALPEGHTLIANSLNSLATALREAGDYVSAEPLLRRALAIRLAALGEDHPQVAASKNNLAIDLMLLGDLEEAEQLLREALPIQEKQLGRDPRFEGYLSNLAVLLMDKGDYAASLEMQERALKFLREKLPPDDPMIGLALHNLGELKLLMGDRDQARQFLEKALALRLAELPENHVDTARTIQALGVLHRDQGDIETARRYWEEALAMRRVSRRERHWEVGETLSALAGLHAQEGDLEVAAALYQKAIDIETESLGPEHPRIAMTTVGRADVLFQLGRRNEALQLYETALGIQQDAYGPDHPAAAVTLERAARLEADGGDRRRGLRMALEAERIWREHARLTLQVLAERQALAFVSVRPSGLDIALSLSQHGLMDEDRKAIWESLIHSRSLVLDEMTRRRRELRISQQDPETRQLLERLRTLRRRLAYLTIRARPEAAPADRAQEEKAQAGYLKAVDRTREEKERIESELARRIVPGRAIRTDGGLAEIRQHLPEGTGLVAYVRFDDPFRRPEPGANYLAMVLTAESGTETVPLGSAAVLEDRIRQWHELAGSPPAGRNAEAEYREAAAALKESMWDPVAELLKGQPRVLIVPDGAIYLVNPATFPVGEGQYLADTGPLIHVLNAERDLLQSVDVEPSGKGLLVMADADFDASREVVPARDMFARTRSSGACNLDPRAVYSPLPATADEARTIAALWEESIPDEDVTMRTGAAASEGVFWQLAPGRRVIHVATHAFFTDPTCPGGQEESFVAATRRAWSGSGGSAPDIVPRSPLLWSGLVMAGANGLDVKGNDDGLVTAEEILSLDLTGTEWVVLSACETGLGLIQPGEGVLGLQRAFTSAGAGTVIMSLWRIDDRFATVWMRHLFENRFRGRMDTAESMRAANVWTLEQLRGEGRSTHPYLWGAFVAAGDWR